MILFPMELVGYLQALHARRRLPAWLAVDSKGLLLQAGGHTELYGLDGLLPGSLVEDELLWLTGLLPHRGEAFEFPLVEDVRHPYEPHLLEAADGNTLIVMLDASELIEAKRACQQVRNEAVLLASSAQAPIGAQEQVLLLLPRALDLAVLEFCDDEQFKVWQPAPDWLDMSAGSVDRWALFERFPLVESFLEELSPSAVTRTGFVARSEIWEENDGRNCYAEVLMINGRTQLVIRPLGPFFDELRSRLQTARMRALED